MHIVELSERASVPVGTVEYYQREGLIEPPGDEDGYGPRELRRLRLVRVLVEVGGLGPGEVRGLLDRMTADGHTPHAMFGLVLNALEGPSRRDDVSLNPGEDPARSLAERLSDRHGWDVDPDTADWSELLKLLRAVLWLDETDAETMVEAYATAADRMTRAEIDVMGLYGDVDALIERLVLWTVFGDPLLAALRRIARKEVSRRRFDREFSPADRGALL
ncbi:MULTISPECIES: MerR family transcriptional regulator [unclassified Nocardiopsis]|uniref:MerR family transcriptional regulator n=1 Tax=Nocardiopsis TaxID=2013 RepID=UPI00387ACF71